MSIPPLVQNSVLASFAEEVGESGPIAIEGGRTRWDVGGKLHSDARIIKAPRGVVNFQPEEMTVVVRAGTSVAELTAALAEKGQRCALPDRGGTVGGAIAVGENDLAVLGKSTVRSSLLEVRYVSAEGRLIRGGGPTVKNVSGFDLPRLMVGSLGTLSCIAEVILRTNPIPTLSQWYEIQNVDPFDVFQRLFRPSAVLWNGATTWALLEGHGNDVYDQARVLSHLGVTKPIEVLPTFPLHRWSLQPSDIRNISKFDTGNFVASLGVGLVLADKPQPQRHLSESVQEVTSRIKQNFDPTGRLNPGRAVGRRQ